MLVLHFRIKQFPNEISLPGSPSSSERFLPSLYNAVSHVGLGHLRNQP